ncbi:MAG: type II toxin-antitoxin system HicB family antitoxin [Burkholderiaceae bacterium]
MKNTMMIDGQQAVITYDPNIEMFRGEFVGLNGGADFYAADVAGLQREGKVSFETFLDECAKHGVEPRKNFSGKFVLRIEPEVHQAAVIAAAANGESLNQWVSSAIREATHAS